MRFGVLGTGFAIPIKSPDAHAPSTSSSHGTVMDKRSKQAAATQLECAAGLIELAREKLKHVGWDFPALFEFTSSYLGSQIEGTPAFHGFPEVIQFLRHGHDSDDHHVKIELLGWNDEIPTRARTRAPITAQGPIFIWRKPLCLRNIILFDAKRWPQLAFYV